MAGEALAHGVHQTSAYPSLVLVLELSHQAAHTEGLSLQGAYSRTLVMLCTIAWDHASIEQGEGKAEASDK